ncbi:MAG: SRPBCC family protein [Wenzhouxiangellaceae bacterium]
MKSSAALLFQPPASDLQPQDLATAHALPAEFYTHSGLERSDRQAVFARSWQLVARTDQLREPGDHVLADIAGVPLLLVHGDDGELRALHNVCRHRAGPLALCDGRGLKALRCHYHGWVYNLRGELRGAPEMDDAADFDLKSIQLPQAQIAVWRNLVFAALQPAVSLAETLTGIDERIGVIEEYAFHQRVSYDVDCHWKVYVDNFLEGYHLPLVHPGLNRLLDYRSYRTEISDWHSLQWSPLEQGDAIYGNGQAWYYFIYPNTMLNILPGRLQTNRVIPLGLERCRVIFDYYYADHQQTAAADAEFSDQIQDEDIAICEAVQRNLMSGSYRAGRLNPKRESGVHHFHERLRQAYREWLASA